jgi:hypothetical protein
MVERMPCSTVCCTPYTLGTASLSLGIKTKFILNVFDFLLINFSFYLFLIFFVLSIPWAS